MQKSTQRKPLTIRKTVLVGAVTTAFPLMFLLAGYHPLIHSFSDPASDRFMPYFGIALVALMFLGSAAFWVWGVHKLIVRAAQARPKMKDK